LRRLARVNDNWTAVTDPANHPKILESCEEALRLGVAGEGSLAVKLGPAPSRSAMTASRRLRPDTGVAFAQIAAVPEPTG
jgi:hypothetical protein